jgi:hypothetical protein
MNFRASPGDAGPRCRAAHRAEQVVSPLRLPSLTPARCAFHLDEAGGGAGLLFPSTFHGVLAVKVCACFARWRPAAVVEPVTAALRRVSHGLMDKAQ